MRAAELWEARAGTDYEAAWKAGETAVQLVPDRPEGHFWLAANMGTLADEGGLGQGLKLRGRIRKELQRTIAIDPTYEEGSAEAALGQWYAKVPGLFGGDHKQAEARSPRDCPQPAEPHGPGEPGRLAARPGTQGRGVNAPAARHRRADRPRMGARGPGDCRRSRSAIEENRCALTDRGGDLRGNGVAFLALGLRARGPAVSTSTSSPT